MKKVIKFVWKWLKKAMYWVCFHKFGTVEPTRPCFPRLRDANHQEMIKKLKETEGKKEK